MDKELNGAIKKLHLQIHSISTLGMTGVGIFAMLQTRIKNQNVRLLATFILLNLIYLTPDAAKAFIKKLPGTTDKKIKNLNKIENILRIIFASVTYPSIKVIGAVDAAEAERIHQHKINNTKYYDQGFPDYSSEDVFLLGPN